MLNLKTMGFLVLSIFPACLLTAIDSPPHGMCQFENFAKRAMQAYHVPGVSIALVKDGKIAYANGFGYRDIERNLPVTPESVFAIGSCTKAFTATAVGILVDQGKVEWDTPIKKYLPDFKMYDSQTTENLSLRDCLCHRSGMPEYGYDFMWENFKSNSEVVFTLQYLKPNAKLREKFQYNNLMYALVGYVIESISHKPSWDVFVRENITDPLGMNNTYFSSEFIPTHSNAALAYEFNKSSKSFKQVEYCKNVALAAGPAGSMYSSAIDMGKWIIKNLNGCNINPEIHEPQIAVGNLSYCLGWAKTTEEKIWHNGGIAGCSALVSFIPKEKIGIVVLSNIEHAGDFTELLEEYAMAYIFSNQEKIDMLEKTLSEKFIYHEKHTPIIPSKAQTISNEELEKFAGTYTNDVFGNIIISVDNFSLMCTYANEPSKLDYIKKDMFKILDEERTFIFKKDTSEIPDKLELEIEKDCWYEFIKVI